MRVREVEATQTAAVEGQGLPPLADLGPHVPVDQVVAPVGSAEDGPAEDGPAEASQVLTSKKKKVINQKKKRQEEKEKRERRGTQEALPNRLPRSKEVEKGSWTLTPGLGE